MNCDEYFEKFYQYLDKNLDSATTEEIEVHLKRCRPCWDRADFERKLKERLRSSCCVERCTESLKLRIKTLLDKF